MGFKKSHCRRYSFLCLLTQVRAAVKGIMKDLIWNYLLKHTFNGRIEAMASFKKWFKCRSLMIYM